MNRPGALRQQVVLWGILLGAWCLLVLTFAEQHVLMQSQRDPSFGLAQGLKLSLSDWFPWLILAPIVAWLGFRFPLERHKLRLSVPVHVVGCILASIFCATFPHPGGPRPGMPPERPGPGMPMGAPEERPELAQRPGYEETGRPGQFPPFPRPGGARRGPFFAALVQSRVNLPIYWIIVSITHALMYYRRAQERERKAVELEARLADAKLDALRMQLHPHFLFNTLNAISTLVHKDPHAADEMIANLSELLRATLDAEGQEIPLRQELGLLERYLEIQQARFGDRLKIEKHINASALDGLVPTLILQPLVENAIRHGIEPRTTPGLVVIEAQRKDGLLQLSVADNGAGMQKSAGKPPGIGLANTKARIKELYGSTASLILNSKSGEGFSVQIEIPFRSHTG
jgi:hypothetical protein